ncbi:MAG TPA: hypothetical protein QF874_01115 [Pelagibacteraceae bacterium]|nr:hypothetical protein [Pelagibacteraceae bacterium]
MLSWRNSKTEKENIKNLYQQVQYANTYGYLGSLGFVVMATDTVRQENLRTLAPDGVSISVAPVASPNEIKVEGLRKHIDTMANAASLTQPDAPPDLICMHVPQVQLLLASMRLLNKYVLALQNHNQ